MEFPDGTSEQWKSYEIDPDMVITVVASGYVLFMNILLVNLVIAMFRWEFSNKNNLDLKKKNTKKK